MICENCGREIIEDVDNCPFCGNKLVNKLVIEKDNNNIIDIKSLNKIDILLLIFNIAVLFSLIFPLTKIIIVIGIIISCLGIIFKIIFKRKNKLALFSFVVYIVGLLYNISYLLYALILK